MDQPLRLRQGMPTTAAPARPAPGRFDDALVRYAYRIALRYVHDADAAWDVTQEALIRVLRHQASYRGDSAYSTWVFRIVATSALMHLRSGRRRAREISADGERGDERGLFDRLPSGANPERDVASAECAAVALAAVDRLGDKYGRVFRLRYGEGCSETEVARLIGAPLPTVKTRAHRALVAARQAA